MSGKSQYVLTLVMPALVLLCLPTSVRFQPSHWMSSTQELHMQATPVLDRGTELNVTGIVDRKMMTFDEYVPSTGTRSVYTAPLP